jgi:competence protein ComEA
LAEALPARIAVLALLTLGAIGAVAYSQREGAEDADAASQIVEVRGEVPGPGLYPILVPATAHAALRAAGRDPAGLPDAALPPGTGLFVGVEGYDLVPIDVAYVLGQPVAINSASAAARAALPGLSDTVARAIVDDRAQNGPFLRIEDLDRVKGIGPSTVEQLRPYVILGAVP